MPIRRPTTGPFAGPEVASPTDQGAATDFSAVSVPISQPRYQFKTRVNRKMTVTDTSASETDNGRSPSDYLSHRGREALHVRQGPLSYSEPIEYRSYACYRHGARQIHTHSVGYSSDGDLILMRREVSVVSDRDDPLRSVRRRGVGVDSATCLNPKAKPSAARLDEDADPSRWQGARIDRLKKYPGVRCPKNRKTRNRLLNDHFSTAATRALYDAAAADSDPEGLRRPAERIFEPLPPRVAANLLHGTEAAQQAEMKRLGLLEAERVVKQRAPASVNSAAFRFAQLNARLKGELQHAVSSTDFMPGFIEDLEAQVQSLITAAAASTDAPRSLVVPCKDGYGRLITHGVAAFYRLTSQSETTDDGARVTVVALPKKAVALPEQRLLSYLRGGADRSPNPGSMSPPVHATSTPIPVGAKASMPLGSSLSSPEVEGVPTAATRSTRAIPIRRLHRRFGRSRCFPVGASVTPDFGAVDCEESSPAEDSADEAAAAATRRLRFRRRRRVALGAGMSKLVMPSSMADP